MLGMSGAERGYRSRAAGEASASQLHPSSRHSSKGVNSRKGRPGGITNSNYDSLARTCDDLQHANNQLRRDYEESEEGIRQFAEMCDNMRGKNSDLEQNNLRLQEHVCDLEVKFQGYLDLLRCYEESFSNFADAIQKALKGHVKFAHELPGIPVADQLPVEREKARDVFSRYHYLFNMACVSHETMVASDQRNTILQEQLHHERVENEKLVGENQKLHEIIDQLSATHDVEKSRRMFADSPVHSPRCGSPCHSFASSLQGEVIPNNELAPPSAIAQRGSVQKGKEEVDFSVKRYFTVPQGFYAIMFLVQNHIFPSGYIL